VTQRRQRDQPAVEQVLSETAIAFIGEFCSTVGIPRDKWLQVPALRSALEPLALYRLVDALRAQRGFPQERAMNEASEQLGISAGAVSERVRQWLKVAWKDTT
jgi:hypothetical protein